MNFQNQPTYKIKINTNNKITKQTLFVLLLILHLFLPATFLLRFLQLAQHLTQHVPVHLVVHPVPLQRHLAQLPRCRSLRCHDALVVGPRGDVVPEYLHYSCWNVRFMLCCVKLKKINAIKCVVKQHILSLFIYFLFFVKKKSNSANKWYLLSKGVFAIKLNWKLNESWRVVILRDVK